MSLFSKDEVKQVNLVVANLRGDASQDGEAVREAVKDYPQNGFLPQEVNTNEQNQKVFSETKEVVSETRWWRLI